MRLQKARTQQSAEAFLRGLCSTGQHDPKRTSCTPLLKLVSAPSWPIHVQPKYHDPVLRFFEICPAYDAYVKEVRHSFLVRSAFSLCSLLPDNPGLL